MAEAGFLKSGNWKEIIFVFTAKELLFEKPCGNVLSEGLITLEQHEKASGLLLSGWAVPCKTVSNAWELLEILEYHFLKKVFC